MTAHTPQPVGEFQDALLRTIYEHVERRGAVTMDDLVREVRVDDVPTQSKPARLGTDSYRVPLSLERLRDAVETLEEEGYLTEEEGTIRVALAVSSIEHGLESGTIRLRLAREADREGLLETMRAVASDGPYVVGEDVAERIAREPALVRRNDERSRTFFVAVRVPDHDESESRTDDGTPNGSADAADELVGWLHIEALELPSLRHTGELTVGIRPDHRRERIGSKLLEYGLEWAEVAGYRKVCQRVPATNEGAIAFLEANDWQREGVREEQYWIDGEFVDEILLATWP